MNGAIYPGTFDPPTFGHLDIIKRANGIFKPFIVAVAANPQKGTLFSVEERVALLQEILGSDTEIIIDSFYGLLIDYVKKRGMQVVIRGLRAVSDFEYEFQMALTNDKLAPHIETIFMMASEPFCYVSSRMIKEIALLGGDLSSFIPAVVIDQLKKKMTGDT